MFKRESSPKEERMKLWFAATVLITLFLSGCSRESEIRERLECVITEVAYTETGQVTRFKKEDAVRNGFVYHFRFLDDGTVVVNDADRYIPDAAGKRSYSLVMEEKVINYMKFRFNEAYDDVKFLLVRENIEYHYSCTKETK